MTLTTDLSNTIEHCMTADEDELGPLFDEAFRTARAHFGNRIAFHMPGMVHFDTDFFTATDPYRFPSISVSGTQCALDCDHCSGRLLETMLPATTPDALWETMLRVREHGGKGCLVSGGSTPKGNTPLQRFIPVLKRAKEELGLDIVVHTGVVLPEVARGLAEAGVDGAMLDIIGSDETLRQVYHLDVGVEVFDRSMSLLEEHGVPVMPHIVVGLHYGRLLGEAEAIRMIAAHSPAAVVVVAFMPLDRTPMAHTRPAPPVDIARVILAARLAIPDRPLVLGCARPLGEHRRTTDILAIRAGVNAIAYPTEEGYEFAKSVGLEPVMSVECCTLLGRSLLAHE